MLGGAAAEAPSGGTSTFLVVVAWAGFATSSIQCMNGIVRTVEAASNPDSDSLARWDQNRIYPPSGVKLRPPERRYKPYIVVLLVRFGAGLSNSFLSF